ncbi:MAG TPA: ABC transporter permease, partial [Desulfobacter postgatei]|nr:ABC transporter permease [Desulfobacter postgatei]
MPLTTGAMDISAAELALASLFIVAAGAISMWSRIGLGKSILTGAVRCVLQLTIMGYVLSFIFGMASAWIVLLLFCVMVAFAVRIVRGNVSEKSIPFVFPSFISM